MNGQTKMSNLEVSYLSNSQLERLSSCPLSYFNQYLNPEKPSQENVVSFYADFGTLCHFLAEMYPKYNELSHLRLDEQEKISGRDQGKVPTRLNEIKSTLTSLTLKDAFDIYNEVFELIDFPDFRAKHNYNEQGRKFVATLPHRDWSNVIALEQEFSIDLEGLPKINGFIDKVERDEKGIIITDYKTSKPYTLEAISKKKQLPIYGMASWFLYGEMPYKYRYDFIRFNKVVEVEIPIEQISYVKKQIYFQYQTLKSFIKEEKYPAVYNSFYCNNFCGFSRLCPTYLKYNEE